MGSPHNCGDLACEPHRKKGKAITGNVVHLSHLIIFVGIFAQTKIRFGKLLRTIKILNRLQNMKMFFPEHLGNIQAGCPLLSVAYMVQEDSENFPYPLEST
jgi:hypothetical protein